MKSYLALIKVDLKLAFRDKAVIFFNYLFPLIFFFVFAGLMRAERGGTISYVVSLVLVMGILGNGLFGAGLRAVQEREANILRRFKVAPISPAPLLVASLVSGWVIYVPIVLLVLGLAHFVYGMPVPGRPFASVWPHFDWSAGVSSHWFDSGVRCQLHAGQPGLDPAVLHAHALPERGNVSHHAASGMGATRQPVHACLLSRHRLSRHLFPQRTLQRELAFATGTAGNPAPWHLSLDAALSLGER